MKTGVDDFSLLNECHEKKKSLPHTTKIPKYALERSSSYVLAQKYVDCVYQYQPQQDRVYQFKPSSGTEKEMKSVTFEVTTVEF